MNRRNISFLVAASVALLLFGSIFFAASRVEQGAAETVYRDLAKLPHQRVGLVLGCSPVLSTGEPNWFFENRIDAAANIFQAGKVEFLLVSGDHHIATYDEPSAMKDALIAKGVTVNRIFCDYAGFSTLDSVVRAKKIFGLTELCVISQRDHAWRAIYVARANGITAVGFPAEEVSALNGLRTRARESLARVKTLLDVHLLGREPRFLGPAVVIASRGE
jgi:SanA protein